MRARKLRNDDEGIANIIEFITSFMIFVILLAAFYGAIGVQFPKTNLIDLNERMKLVRIGNMLINEEGQTITGASDWEDFVGDTESIKNIGRIGFAYSGQTAGVLSMKKINAINTIFRTGGDSLEKAFYNKTRELMSLDTGQYFNIRVSSVPGFIGDASFEEFVNTSQWEYTPYGNWLDHYAGGRNNYWSTEGKNSYSLSWMPVYDCKAASQPFFIYNTSTNSSRMYYTGYDSENARILSAGSTDNITWTWEKDVKINIGGMYDRLNATSPFVLKLPDNSYRMYYAGNDSTNTRILSAISVDGGVTWNKENGVRLPTGGTYDLTDASMPFIFKFLDTYRMYYSGYDGANWRILNATSTDGIFWTKQPGIAIDKGGIYDATHAYSPCVIRHPNGTYQMFYVGIGAPLRSNITSAWSSDGITWDKSNMIHITPSSASNTVSSPNVVSLPNNPNNYKYRMYYTESNGTNSWICSALSRDGMYWPIIESGARIDEGGVANSSEGCKIRTYIDLTNTAGIMFDMAIASTTQENLFDYNVILSNDTSQIIWNRMDVSTTGTLKNVYINTSNKRGWYALEVRIDSALNAGGYASESIERKIYIDNFRTVSKELLGWGRNYEKADEIHSYNRIVNVYDESNDQYMPANVVITLFRGIVRT